MYTLYYANFRARQEVIRLVLEVAHVEYKMVACKVEEFQTFVQQFPTKQIPVLQLEDGKYMTQSAAIVKYLAAKHGLLPEDLFKQFRLDEVYGSCEDLTTSLFPLFYNQDAEAKKKAVEEYLKTSMPVRLNRLNMLVENAQKESAGGDFITGEKVSWADLHLFNLLDLLLHFDEGLLKGDNATALNKVYNAVKALPEVVAYLDKRAPMHPYFAK